MTARAEPDPWARLDALSGARNTVPASAVGKFAFYGRCSTEDQQDPATSRGWQLGSACRFAEPLGGHVSAEFFDVGQSRSVPWQRRPAAAQLLDALKVSSRGWSAVVVGEGTRCWFGNQFSLIAPRLAAYGVSLWVPELGGQFQARNPSHTMLMSLLGGMSESERQHVQARVRAAMDAQVVNEGRHQGGRAPYGFLVVDGELHPHPRKAADGHRLQVLRLDIEAAAVVRRIYSEYLDGVGDRAIADGLNSDGIACPSARHPEQNRHRRGDGWQGSTVRSILENPRYTGYAVFGRWTKHDMLLDPDDVSAGHVVRFRRAAPETVVRSRKPAHPEIVSVEDFTQVQVLRRSKTRGAPATAAKAERAARRTSRCYLFQGLLRCALCGRKMECGSTKSRSYYRCLASTLPPRSSLRESHPTSAYLREDTLMALVNQWLCEPHATRLLPGDDPTDDHTAALNTRDAVSLAGIYQALRLDLRFDKARGILSAALPPLAAVGDVDTTDWIRLTVPHTA